MAKGCIRGSRLSREGREARVAVRERSAAREGGGRRAKSPSGRLCCVVWCVGSYRGQASRFYIHAHRIARRHIGRYRSRACTLLLAGGYRLPRRNGKERARKSEREETGSEERENGARERERDDGARRLCTTESATTGTLSLSPAPMTVLGIVGLVAVRASCTSDRAYVIHRAYVRTYAKSRARSRPHAQRTRIYRISLCTV